MTSSMVRCRSVKPASAPRRPPARVSLVSSLMDPNLAAPRPMTKRLFERVSVRRRSIWPDGRVGPPVYRLQQSDYRLAIERTSDYYSNT